MDADSDNLAVVNRARKPYVKPTQSEIDERVGLICDWLSEGVGEGAIKQRGRNDWGVCTRTVESYLFRARGKMVESSQRPKEEWREEQLRKYKAIADDTAVAHRDRLKALERIDKIFGLEQHDWGVRKVELSGPDGGPIQSQSTVVNLDLSAKLGEYGAAIRSAALANVLESIAQSKPIPVEAIDITS